MPITLGTTSKMPPATPDLAGSPTYDRDNGPVKHHIISFVFLQQTQQYHSAEQGISSKGNQDGLNNFVVIVLLCHINAI